MRLFMDKEERTRIHGAVCICKNQSRIRYEILAYSALVLWTLIFLLRSISYPQTRPGSTSQAAVTLTLHQAVERALQNNSSLKAAHDGLAMAQQKVPQAVSRYLPEVNFDESFTRGNNPVYVFGSLLNQRQFGPQNFALPSLNKPDALDNFQAKLSVQQVVYDAGKIRGLVAQARLGERVAQQDVEKTRQELIFRVVNAYTLHLLARSAQQVADEAVRTAEASRVRAESLYQSGMIVESDKLAAQVFVARMLEQLLKAKNQVALSRANLNFEMGLPVDNPIEMAAELTEVRFDSEPQESLLAHALEQRPDYLQTVLLKDIAKEGVGIARSEFLPQIGVYGSLEADSQTFVDRGGNNWIVGARLHFNLFRGRSDKAQLEEAKANLERSMALSNYVSAAVRLQVKQTTLDLDNTRQRVEVTKSAIAQAEETLRIVQNRYGAGMTTITELLRAQTDLTQARTAYLQALYDHRIAKANTELAAGTLTEQSQVLNQ
jgi:outer membrane protein